MRRVVEKLAEGCMSVPFGSVHATLDRLEVKGYVSHGSPIRRRNGVVDRNASSGLANTGCLRLIQVNFDDLGFRFPMVGVASAKK